MVLALSFTGTRAQFTLSGTLTKMAGRHQVKFGGQVRRVSWISDPDNNNVSLNFNQFATASSSPPGPPGGVPWRQPCWESQPVLA